MYKIWNYISNLGISKDNRDLSQRTIILTNQLNFVTLISISMLLLTTLITIWFINAKPSYGTLRVIALLVVSFLNLAVARFGFTKLSRLLLIFLPPVVFLLGPTMIGYVEEESYTYYPFVVIGASIIPQLLVDPHEEKLLYYSSLSFYFILTLLIDKVMVQFGSIHFPIIDRINIFYPWYKIAQIGLFLFINASIYYLRILNFRYEEVLNSKNKVLDLQNAELKEQKEKILRTNEELKHLNEITTRQKDEIVSSIQYAKRIQSAILPPETYITELLNENFILYKPKDIVSGDFYWIKQVKHYIILVSADCTDHGVPGALMSMLGISYLNEIVHKKEVTQANHILNELRKEIKHSLRQTGKKEESRDGIDIALCVIDSKNNIMQYSGAHNPLFIISNSIGEPVLKEIKADPMPVGMHFSSDKSFTNHEIKLEIGDTFYIFSDGFVDQIGGTNNHRFTNEKFKKLLLDIYDQPMCEQKEIMEQTLKNWMGDQPQRDDILVIGARV